MAKPTPRPDSTVQPGKSTQTPPKTPSGRPGVLPPTGY